MRILLTTDAAGGVWDHTVTLARELAEAGHEVRVAAFADPAEPCLDALSPWAEIEARDLRLEWMSDPWADVDAGVAWLADLARRWRPDVAHLNQFASAGAELGCPKMVGAHSDVLSWWGEVRGTCSPAGWGEYEARVRSGLAAADAVVAPSAYQSGLLARHYGRPADRVIWNGAAPPAGPRRPAPTAPLLVTAARAWDPAKGIRVLDAALARLGERAPRAILLGETVSPQGMRLATRRLAAWGRVERAEVDRWLEQATLYVAPSLYEPFGLAPLEAALHGCALLLSDIGSFRELWGGDAAFFRAGSAISLAKAIVDLTRDPGHVAGLASAAQARARALFGADRMGREYMSLYAELRSGSGLGARVRRRQLARRSAWLPGSCGLRRTPPGCRPPRQGASGRRRRLSRLAPRASQRSALSVRHPSCGVRQSEVRAPARHHSLSGRPREVRVLRA